MLRNQTTYPLVPAEAGTRGRKLEQAALDSRFRGNERIGVCARLKVIYASCYPVKTAAVQLRAIVADGMKELSHGYDHQEHRPRALHYGEGAEAVPVGKAPHRRARAWHHPVRARLLDGLDPGFRPAGARRRLHLGHGLVCGEGL